LGVWVLFGRNWRRQNASTETLSIPLESASDAEIRLRHGAGKIQVLPSDDPSILLSGSFNGGINHTIAREGTTAKVKLRTPSEVVVGIPWMTGSEGYNWKINLNRDIPIRLDIKTGASENTLDLADLRISDLRIETGASATRITMPSRAGLCTVKIEAGAASVDLLIPEGVAGRIQVQSGLSGININTSRFAHTGNYYESPDFNTAVNKIDIRVESGVGSISVR
jgi:hypothetical protein